MKIFQLDKRYSIVCRSENTRSGFRHLATLMEEGDEVDDAKCCYQNRTWESYTFQSVIHKILRQNFEDEQLAHYIDVCAGKAKDDFDREFGMIGAIAQMGEVLCSEEKEKNDWKARMLKAGLPGLELPEDWGALSEDEKAARLDKVIALTKGGDE